jgi:hypothetical protein
MRALLAAAALTAAAAGVSLAAAPADAADRPVRTGDCYGDWEFDGYGQQHMTLAEVMAVPDRSLLSYRCVDRGARVRVQVVVADDREETRYLLSTDLPGEQVYCRVSRDRAYTVGMTYDVSGVRRWGGERARFSRWAAALAEARGCEVR